MAWQDRTVACAQPAALDFYFFNPDSSQSNLSRLKREMDSALALLDFPVKFQSFVHLNDFQRQMREKKPALLFVPEWFLRRHGSDFRLRPLLRSIYQGADSYRKVLLVARDTAADAAPARSKTLAMTTLGPDETATLDKIPLTGNTLPANSLNVIHVPKDSDALFALALRQVDLALISRLNLDALAAQNPNLVKLVRPVAETAPIPNPLLCYVEGSMDADKLRAVTALFRNITQKATGSNVLEMLHIDEWQKISN